MEKSTGEQIPLPEISNSVMKFEIIHAQPEHAGHIREHLRTQSYPCFGWIFLLQQINSSHMRISQKVRLAAG